MRRLWQISTLIQCTHQQCRARNYTDTRKKWATIWAHAKQADIGEGSDPAICASTAASQLPESQMPQNVRTQQRSNMVEGGWRRSLKHPSMRKPMVSSAHLQFCEVAEICSFMHVCNITQLTSPLILQTNLNFSDFVHAMAREGIRIDSPTSMQPEVNHFLQDPNPPPGSSVKERYSRVAAASPVGKAAHKTPLYCSVLSWTRLIAEHTKCGQGREALRIYKEMREKGVIPNTYTFVAALKACSGVADLQAGKEIHTHVVESGAQSDVFVASTLVDMYAKCGSMEDACQVFENMRYRTLVSWTAMIVGYTQIEKGGSALQLYKQMQDEGFAPDARTFVAALKACGSLAVQEEGKQVDGENLKVVCLQKGKAIHHQVAKSGFESDIFVASTLVDMYVKCGSMGDARQVFERMPYRNVVAWTAMILGYAQMEKGELALQLYAKMQNEGLTPDARTFVAALKACSSLAGQDGRQVEDDLLKIQCLEKGRAIHIQVINYGFQSNLFVANSLIDMYAKCGSIVDACKIFERMPYHNVVSWTTMIMSCAVREEEELALQLYERMQCEGFKPDARTFVASLKACSSLAAQEEGKRVNGESLKIVCLEKGRAIHSQAAESGFESNLYVASSLVDMYAKCGSMVDAQHVFERMPHRNVVLWTAMIMAYTQMEKGELALQLYARMQQEGFTPNDRTFVAALSACGSLAALERGKEIHAKICSIGLQDDAFVATCLVDMYGKCGSMVDAQHVFDTSPARDVTKWSALIAGYSHQGDCEHVFNLFERMQQEGMRPISITFVSVLTACSHAGVMDKGQKYFHSMCSDFGIIPTSEHFNCMVDLLGRAGQVDEALAMLKKMPFKLSVVTWMTILGACRIWNKVEVGTCAFECVAMLDRKQAAGYVLMKTIYASAHV